ncbi:radical SAM protein [Bailinhaonella thermotolerans]|uniref:Radical SAM protein n=1 Tax=Bailinhaonella thermotolerans TaxID=1070861 RepID=A0A3A4AJ37_9ACTN|nr:radical SAM protein [Bailinhaonella thermotolerans]RJL27084.1 radical SAM protein [Bailinhaonella thermotolerans]
MLTPGPADTRAHRVRSFLERQGAPPYRFQQLLHELFGRGVTEFGRMTALPLGLRSALAARFGPSWPGIRAVASERRGQVRKVLFEAERGVRFETVFSRYRAGWTSLCVSSQAGCGLGCGFCATGAIGLVRNLTADEICDQVLHFRRETQVSSVSFMGMGEALANPHTFTALGQLTDPLMFGISPRRITVSTVGFLPGLRRLARERPGVVITLSVHSPDPAERAALIPLEHRFPLEECLAVLDEHAEVNRRKVYLAYLLIDRVNDSVAHARDLAGLVRARRRPGLFHVSVIPYNHAAGVNPDYRPPPPRRAGAFLAALRDAGVRAARRQQFGADAEAACGQLHAGYSAARR